MSSTLYIIDSKSKQKLEALLQALAKSPSMEISVMRVRAEHMPDVSPLSERDASEAAETGVNAVIRSFLSHADRLREVATGICVQKYVSVHDAQPHLGCVIAKRNSDAHGVDLFCCDPVPVPSELSKLVSKGIHLYDAYGMIYGQDVKDKKVPLFEVINPGQSEVSWMADGIAKAIGAS